eukprot:NODE_1208_length_2071_cov_53.219199_g911_i1.p1 GENE.NODE_1208_length_2071_cov_53.219199_g911_i1~~NODE_1208_length_2071_cov_53.219199_g911_i1.p1  ORF type:complete len:616 (+),score=124.13 NODE_1208_length_2071_cov_53.219199_g911_i1:160-1848(+)
MNMHKLPPRTAFDTPEERHGWEAAVESILIQPTITNAQEILVQLRTGLNSAVERTSPMADQVLEILPINDLEQKQKLLPCLFRIRSLLSLELFETIFLSSPQNTIQHPFLALVLKFSRRLALLSHTTALTRWLQVIWENYFLKLERATALECPVSSILANASSLSGKGSQSSTLKYSFEEFKNSWNAVRLSVSRFECRELSAPPVEMSEDRPFALCCPEPQDPGIYFTAMLYTLVTAQTGFLDEVSNLVSTQASARWIEPLLRPERVDLRNANVSQLCILEPDKLLSIISNYSYQSLEYGKGRNYGFDFSRIEKALANKLLVGKVLLTDVYPAFLYKYELRKASTLTDVEQKVEQSAMSLHQLEAVCSSVDSQQASQLMTTLAIAMGFLHQMGGNPDMEIPHYLQSVLRLPTATTEVWLRNASISHLKLRNVTSLYSTLEDLVTDVLVESIHIQYTDPLPESGLQALKKAARVIPVSQLRVAIGRMIARRLVGASQRPELEMGPFLLDTSLNAIELWPTKSVTEEQLEGWLESGLLPVEIQLRHAYSCYTELGSGSRRHKKG